MNIVAYSIISVVFAVLIYPPFSLWPIAFIAFVPLLYLCARHSVLHSFLILLVIGFFVENLIFVWIYRLEVFTPIHGLLLGLYFALYWAIWGGCTSWFLRSNLSQFLKMFSIASIWVMLDYTMANLGFLAFPWNTLAQSQFLNLW